MTLPSNAPNLNSEPDTAPKPNPENENATESGAQMPPASLRPTPARLATLTANLRAVRSRIASASASASAAAASSADANGGSQRGLKRVEPPRLVAVSKLKPLSDIYGLYRGAAAGEMGGKGDEAEQRQLHFGENYVQELLEKSRTLWDYEEEVPEPEGEEGGKRRKMLVGREVRWHFIGGLQSNKAVQLAREVKGLWCVESVDSVKKARGLGKGWAERSWRRGDGEEEGKGEKLRVMIQVNTSGEEGKSGVQPESAELRDLARCVLEEEQAGRLQLVGLMTIGAIARSRAAKEGEENEDFVRLREVRTWLVRELSWEDEQRLELSMGMSEDFESAVRLGSGEVRVGSTIFGERPAKSEAKVV